MLKERKKSTAGVQDLTYESHDGLSLHYVDYAGGSGLPVICLHGLTRNARDFRDLAPHLASSRRVICVDFRGRGLSQWDAQSDNYHAPVYVQDVLTLLNQIDLDRIIVIGTSLGGIVGTGLIQSNPNLVAGIVLNDIGPVIDPAGLARIGGHVGREPQWSGWQSAAAAFKERNSVVHPNFTDEQWLDFAEKSCRMTDEGVIVQDYDPAIAQAFGDGTADLELWPLFQTLEPVPALLLRGELSDLLSAETAEDMDRKLPKLDFVTVPNCGHVPTLMEAEALGAIDAFIAKVDDLET